MTFWFLVLGLPLCIAGVAFLALPARAAEFLRMFPRSRMAGAILCAIAWFWTAYECDTIGIDVFDMLLKRFPGQLWIMASVLTYLTIIWMPKNLLTRSIMGLFMLIPAELFRFTRPLLPESGFAPVQIVVAFAYLLAIIGMYGMFYPWRVEAVVKRVFRRR